MTDLGADRPTDTPRPIRLGAFSTAGAHLIPLAVMAFRERFPDVPIAVSSAPATVAPAQLHDQIIDIAVVWEYDFARRPEEKGLNTTHLLNDPLRTVLPADHWLAHHSAVSLRELAGEGWIVRDRHPSNLAAFEAICRVEGFEPSIVFRTDDYPAALGLVAAGIGVSLVPQLCLLAQRPDVVVRPLKAPKLSRRVCTMTLPDAESDPVVAGLVEALREVAGRLSVPSAAPPLEMLG